MVFAHFPDVQEVVVAYVWLATTEVMSTTYERRFVSALWGALEPRFKAVQDAVELVGSLFTQRGQTLAVDVPEALPGLVGDGPLLSSCATVVRALTAVPV